MNPGTERFNAQGVLRIAALLFVITLAPWVLWSSIGLHPAARALATGEWWREAWPLYGQSVDRSLRLATACMAVAMLVAKPWARLWLNSRCTPIAWCDALLQRPMAVPVLATLFAGVLAAMPSQGLPMDFVLALVAHMALTLPFVVQRVATALKARAPGAAAQGATSAQPGAVLSAGLLAFALSMGESSLTAMLDAPMAPPWPPALAAMRSHLGTASAALVALTALPLLWGMRAITDALGAPPVRTSWADRS